jgi:hypothetical protein
MHASQHRFWCALGDAATAEALLVAEPALIDGRKYGELVPLAKAFQAQERWLGETVVYRALLHGILERGYAPSYGHGARYLMRLRELANAVGGSIQTAMTTMVRATGALTPPPLPSPPTPAPSGHGWWARGLTMPP